MDLSKSSLEMVVKIYIYKHVSYSSTKIDFLLGIFVLKFLELNKDVYQMFVIVSKSTLIDQ